MFLGFSHPPYTAMQQYYNAPYPSQPNFYNTAYDTAAFNGYTPYAQQPQPALWGSTPYTNNTAGLPPPMQMQSGAPPPAPTAHRSGHRRRATMPSNTNGASKPLKSALKPNNTVHQALVPSNPAPLQRKRAMSSSKRERDRELQTMSTTDYSSAFNNQGMNLLQDESVYMFVSFHGTNELRIENLAHKAMDEIRREIFGMWPGGLMLDELRHTQWKVRFNNAPWSLNGTDAQWTWRMLVRFFTLFAERGYSYNTTLDVGTASPRLHFIASSQSICHFFLATITNRGRVITLIDPPLDIGRDLTPGLQRTLPGHILRDDIGAVGDTTVRSIELRRYLNDTNEITCDQFHCQVLRILEHIGYTLCATLPMARKGPLSALGIGPKQELLVFRSVKSSPVY
ncbi:hypothetical protein EV361DRAFT_951454 [Lentinula raphanica]|nr:hypothetical protein EV361DRAFT_951454 [Lentinula raphanica]